MIQISIESILGRELIERSMDREAFGLSGYARPVSMITLTIILFGSFNLYHNVLSNIIPKANVFLKT